MMLNRWTLVTAASTWGRQIEVLTQYATQLLTPRQCRTFHQPTGIFKDVASAAVTRSLACAGRCQVLLTSTAEDRFLGTLCIQKPTDRCSAVAGLASGSAEPVVASILRPLAAAARRSETMASGWQPWAATEHVRRPGVLTALHSNASGRSLLQPALLSTVVQTRSCAQLTRKRAPKSAGFNNTTMPNTTQLLYGQYGIRALASSRVAHNTIEAVRKTLRRKIQKSARLWTRIRATVPVTKKALGVRMGKGKGVISYYATPVRPGQIIFEMDRVPRLLAMQALQAVQHGFPVKLGFVEWS